VFNLSGSEIVVILLLALIVLGPEKLPEAIRRFARVYGEIRKMSTGFQSEFKTAFDEPLRELRETAQLTKDAVMKPLQENPTPPVVADTSEADPPQKETES
jgi:sec-independent protein translocase protein TatB